MAFVINANDSFLEDVDRVSGGFQIRAYCNSINPVKDLRAAIDESDALRSEDFEAVASFSWAPTTVKQEGSVNEFADTWIQGHDEGYASSVNYQFALMADGYGSPSEIWQALHTIPGTAVVSSYLVPTRNKFSLGGSVPDLRLEGVFLEDDELPEIVLLVQDPRTQEVSRLRVIGVLAPEAAYAAGITVSQATLNGLVSEQVPPTDFLLRVREGADIETAAKAIESTFLEHGMQSVIITEELKEIATTNRMMNALLEGFMSLGLVVGIAALGVVAARSVVERRQQIGILRALGFQKRAVQGVFLMESSFVALLGITLGVVLGALLAMNLINEISQDMHGMAYRIPWLNIGLVVVIAFGASLLTTFLPARGAAKVYPAEALRFE
jgi:putative ABC transport system permease protein